MRKKNWKYIGLLAGAVALAISIYIGREAISRLEAEATYADVAKSVWSYTYPYPQIASDSDPEESYADTNQSPEDRIPPGLITLMQENKAVKGWITIPGTAIDYPVLQNIEDNEFYLHRDLSGKKLYSGSIFLDTTSQIDGPGIISIYGHHMKAGYRYGTMFRDISKFQSTKFLQNHQSIKIYTSDTIYHYTPVLCISTKADPSLRIQPETQEDLRNYFKQHYNLNIKAADKVLVLITCAYNTDNARTYLFCLPETTSE